MIRCLDCPTLIPRGSRCGPCARAHQQRRNQQRGGSGWAWQAIRERIITRDGGCVASFVHECKGPLRVDHIVPLADGGTNSDSNLRTLCLTAHQALTPRGGG